MRCIAYATPACLDATLADYSISLVKSVVLGDDIVPRASKANILRLRDEIKKFPSLTLTLIGGS